MSDATEKPRRTYSPETIAAYGAVIDAGFVAGGDIDAALRHLATMVHCDIAGELRQPHTHVSPNESELAWRDKRIAELEQVAVLADRLTECIAEFSYVTADGKCLCVACAERVQHLDDALAKLKARIGE